MSKVGYQRIYYNIKLRLGVKMCVSHLILLYNIFLFFS